LGARPPCAKCNLGLGHFDDDLLTMLSAANYLHVVYMDLQARGGDRNDVPFFGEVRQH
jgi:hypothetical protein